MLEDDERILRSIAKECKDAKEKVRLLALHAVASGHKVPLVAEVFCVDEETMHRWIERWQKDRDLADKPRDGRPPSLDEKDKERLRKLIEENNPRKHSVNASCWDCGSLAAHFSLNGKLASAETIRRTLKEMGAHYVKAVIRFPEADEQGRLEFAKSFIKQEKRGNAIVLFQDEMGVETSARKGYGWTFKERLVIDVPQTGKKRMNLFGAVSPYTGESIQTMSSTAKADAFVRLLAKIAKKHPRKMVWIYLDNLSTHKSRKVHSFLERHPNIGLRYLPPYSPELNPREYWHGFLRKKLLNNRSFGGTLPLAGAIHSFSRSTPASVIKSVCSLQPIYALAAQQPEDF